MSRFGLAFSELREEMVEYQLRGRGIRDERVLAAMAAIPRELFVPGDLRDRAYDDGPLPIGGGQTISQPYIVARTLELAAIEPGHVVLDIGCGSGYQTAVAAQIARQVYGIEIREELALAARERLSSLGISNAEVVFGDGALGLPELAPFDAILIAAAIPKLPARLIDQLAEGGRAVLPEGGWAEQTLVRYHLAEGVLSRREICPVRFVAFVGPEGNAKME